MPLLPKPALIATIHLPALPGSPRSELSMQAITQRAVHEARLLAEHGFDALIVENFGDAPYFAQQVEPHTVAAMALIVGSVQAAVAIPCGLNVLRNDAQAALAIAAGRSGARRPSSPMCTSSTQARWRRARRSRWPRKRPPTEVWPMR